MADLNDTPIIIDVDFDMLIDPVVGILDYDEDSDTEMDNVGWDVVVTDSVKARVDDVEGGAEITVEDKDGVTIGFVADGYTPVKGVDYYTDDDIDEIVDLVAAQARATYTHNQMTASTVWEIEHNLHKRPSVTVIDSGESVVMGDVTYVSDNKLIIIFSAPFSGKAYLN